MRVHLAHIRRKKNVSLGSHASPKENSIGSGSFSSLRHFRVREGDLPIRLQTA